MTRVKLYGGALTLTWLSILFFKMKFYFQLLFPINTISLYKTGTIGWIFIQHCGYWWPGAFTVLSMNPWVSCCLWIKRKKKRTISVPISKLQSLRKRSPWKWKTKKLNRNIQYGKYKQGKSEGFDSCGWPSDLVWPAWPWNCMDDHEKQSSTNAQMRSISSISQPV